MIQRKIARLSIIAAVLGVALTGCGGGGGGGGGGGAPLAIQTTPPPNGGATGTAGQAGGGNTNNGGSSSSDGSTGNGAGGAGGGTGGSGGGSGSLGNPVGAVFSPAVAKATVAEGGGLSPGLIGVHSVSVTLSGVNTSNLHVYLQNADAIYPDKQTLYGGTATYSNISPIVFKFDFPAGVHTGNIQLHVCSDKTCATEYPVTGGSLPYELTVLPQPKITASINGVPVPDSKVIMALKAGDTVDLHSDMPVTWSTASGGVIVSGVVQTSTDWHAVLGYGVSGSGHTGTLTVNAITPFEPANPEKPQAVTRPSFTLTE